MKVVDNLDFKTFFNKIVIVIMTLIVSLILLEAGLRLIGRMPTNMTDGFYEQYGNSYRLKMDIKKVTNWPSFSYVTYTNSFGFRDKTTGTRQISDKPYYVFLGASDVFANGVNYEDSFVGVFDKLASNNGIEILNMGNGRRYRI